MKWMSLHMYTYTLILILEFQIFINEDESTYMIQIELQLWIIGWCCQVLYSRYAVTCMLPAKVDIVGLKLKDNQ